MRQSVCLVINPITVDSFTSFFNCTPVVRASDSVMGTTKKVEDFFKLVGAGPILVFYLVIRGSTAGFPLLRDFSGAISQPRGLQVSQYVVLVESKSLIRHRPNY